jgi:alkylation response protein AidB-like acyl-CoA dehydrogenase
LTTVTTKNSSTSGANFLLHDAAPEECFFPEDFTEEHKQIAQTAADFMTQEVSPAHGSVEEKDFAVTRRLMLKAGELGLLSVDVPEAYGGLEMDKVASAIVAEETGREGSFCVILGAHTGIGTLPIVWYGTEEQKQRYLPKLASGEWIGAYALSESTSGSDALHARTRAVLSADGTTYTLNGEKMWITNAGMADLFTIFAKCAVPGSGKNGESDQEKLTAFLVERTAAGLSIGPEEHKLGIRGSSTCPVILKDCAVPAANLLGEVGKGHRIAFNILNIGRYKLGATVTGGAKAALNEAIRYAKERKAFGRSIAEFGLIQQKIAACAARVFACEALCYRTIGMIARALDGISGDSSTEIEKRIEEYAVECSIVKVCASEMYDFVADEVVQIFGGYGYVEDYPAERHYRDARINRIFEGTNEINRLIIGGWVLKAATQGKLALMPAIQRLMDEVMAGPALKEDRDGPLAAEFDLLAAAKKVFLFAAGCATQRFAAKLGDEQEVMAALADIIAEIYVLESTVVRASKIVSAGSVSGSKNGAMNGPSISVTLARLYAARSFELVELAARRVIAASGEGDALRTQITILRRLTKHEPADTVALGREIAGYMVRAGRYAV